MKKIFSVLLLCFIANANPFHINFDDNFSCVVPEYGPLLKCELYNKDTKSFEKVGDHACMKHRVRHLVHF